jgi:uncharacterized membrane protein
VVRVILQYRAPAGKAGAALARLLGRSPEQQIARDLMQFKEMIETGEMGHPTGQPVGNHRTGPRF